MLRFQSSYFFCKRFVKANYNHPLTLLFVIFAFSVTLPVASINNLWIGAIMAGLQVCAAVKLTAYALEKHGQDHK